jgi:hypothetical protein
VGDIIASRFLQDLEIEKLTRKRVSNTQVGKQRATSPLALHLFAKRREANSAQLVVVVD